MLKDILKSYKDKQSIPRLPGSLFTYYLNYLKEVFQKNIIFITKDTKLINLLKNDYSDCSCNIPDPESSPSSFSELHIDYKKKYFNSLKKLYGNDLVIYSISPFSLFNKPPEIEYLKKLFFKIDLNSEFNIATISNEFVKIGYVKEDIVRIRGEFAKRGDILDIYPINSEYPIRIEAEFDQVSSIKFFDPSTQRTLKSLKSCEIYPYFLFYNSNKNKENLKIKFNERFGNNINLRLSLAEKMDLINGNDLSSFDNYFKLTYGFVPIEKLFKNSLIIIDNSYEDFINEMESYVSNLQTEFSEELSNGYLSLDFNKDFYSLSEIKNFVENSLFQTVESINENLTELNFKSSKLDYVLNSIENLTKNSFVEIGVNNENSLRKIEELLFEKGISFTKEKVLENAIKLTQSNLNKGFQIKNKYAFVPYSEIFPIKRKSKSRPIHSPFFSDFSDIKEGDFVVHIDYGIAKYKGIKEIDAGGELQEFVDLEFAGNSSVLLPLSRIHLLQKFQNTGNVSVSLSNIRTNAFTKKKNKIKKQIIEYAEELLKLYAERKVAKGIAYSSDSVWQRDFAEEFPYSETEDQLKAIEEIKEDMEKPYPMDRLLCGDVGFGKTEVAMRAVFKSVDNGYQVMVLAPTTVLAFQHFENFKKRFQNYPITIKMLSRFVPQAKQKDIVKEFNNGKVDILIGTHRIFSKDIIPKKLGLLIVDEEQKFGVIHKEKLKMLKKNIDVLSLSATPIPRTLNMSVMGFKDISVIESPPKDRLSVNTCHIVFEPLTIKKAIEFELNRGGQVYFVNNYVKTIEALAATVRKLSPDNARIAVAHGQMNEIDLEKIMLDFFNKKIDILVSTTIIENGMDVDTANTMFINEAHTFGLSQLYQLRGRIGRSDKPAYAYLITPGKQTLTEDARKRIDALEEFSHLGAGFRIAMLDLELRGAGDILGERQSGHINEIGFELYSELLEKAVKELNNEEIIEEETVLQMGKLGKIPKDFIESSAIRLSFLRKLNLSDNFENLLKIREELEDRFGKLPKLVENLIEGHRLRIFLRKIGVSSIEFNKNYCIIYPSLKNKLNIETLLQNAATENDIKINKEGFIQFENRKDSFHNFVDYIYSFFKENSN